jgi:hypothetical protein
MVKKIMIIVHWNGKTDKYMTVLNKTGKVELATLHCDVPPSIVYEIVLGLLS